MNYGYGPQAHGQAQERQQLRRAATLARRVFLQTQTPFEKIERDIRGLQRALCDLEPLQSTFLPEITKRITTIKAEIAALQTQLAANQAAPVL